MVRNEDLDEDYDIKENINGLVNEIYYGKIKVIEVTLDDDSANEEVL